MNKTDKKLLIFCILNLILIVALGILVHMSELARVEYNTRDVKSAHEINEKIRMLQDEVSELRSKVEK